MESNWVDGFEIKVCIENGVATISANREGLLSLANHLKSLAEEPLGSHIHLDAYNSLEEGSSELILEKSNDLKQRGKSMGSVYDSPDIYDLLEDANRYLAYKRHWEHLFGGKNIESMLDISIGSGSVTLPVLDLNITLSGSDLSENMLKKCSKKISDKGFEPDLKVTDFRDLSCWGDQRFDVVASTGNAIAYVSNDDVDRVIEQMDSHVSDNGYIYIDTRNWDKILKDKNRFYLYNPFFVNGERVNFMQVWDYNTDGSMTFNLLYTFEKNNKIYRKEKFEEHYYPVSKDLLINRLKELGYSDIQVLCFPSYFPMKNSDETEWYTIFVTKVCTWQNWM